MTHDAQTSQVKKSALRRWWKRFRSPKLWTYEQYPARPLELPARYHAGTSSGRLQVAIVTPSFQHARFLPATIDSVLRQDYPHLRYIVQDGASSDGTWDILASYGPALQWNSEPDNGQACAINRGFARVSGDVMAWLNSDDILLPGAVKHVVDVFEKNPDVDVVYGHRIYIDTQNRDIGRCILPPHASEPLRWADYIPQETMFWRRRVWEAIGPLDESFHYALDWDFILRAQAAGFRFKRLNLFLGGFRVHPAQKTTALKTVGDEEVARLHLRHLGVIPSASEIRRNIKPFLKQHVLYDQLYRLGLIRP